MTVLGVDLSSSSTGVCTGTGETLTIAPPSKLTLHQRCREIRDGLNVIIAVQDPKLIVFEAIGTRHVQTAIAIATVHALVRDDVDDSYPAVFIEPTKLKKWATGKGAGKGTDKVGMALHAQRLGWNASPEAGDDEADAWLLWTIGRALTGAPMIDDTAYRRAVLADIRKDYPWLD